ncbi:GNAT family N-acetyltransferase [Tessaracoccus sp.]
MNRRGTDLIVKRWSAMSRDDVFDMVVLRTDVYYLEQRINEQDFDAADRDDSTLHMWVAEDDGMTAYLRVVELGKPERGAHRTFGRVVVRADRRREGLARRLIGEVLNRFGHEELIIHAQTYVVGLYEGFGFTVVGEPFDEAGIPHRSMVRAGVASPQAAR